ncbi:MAG: hypothetical protein ACREHG_05405 [Candidatus Saccharimonadales bacterium]
MNDIMRDLTAIATSIIGLAMLTVVLRQSSDTPTVIRESASGFSHVLEAAMGGTGIGAFQH